MSRRYSYLFREKAKESIKLQDNIGHINNRLNQVIQINESLHNSIEEFKSLLGEATDQREAAEERVTNLTNLTVREQIKKLIISLKVKKFVEESDRNK